MDAEVGQRAHRGLLLVEEPVAVHRPALWSGVAHHSAEGDHVTDHALVEQLLRAAVDGVKAHVVADHKVLAVELGGGDHGLALGQRDGHGLFAQDVLARIEGVGGDLRVAAVVHTDGHRVDRGVVEQVEIGVVHLAAVLRGDLLSALTVEVIVADQLDIGVCCVFGQMAHLRNLAAADDSNFNHSGTPPVLSCKLSAKNAFWGLPGSFLFSSIPIIPKAAPGWNPFLKKR